MQSRTIVPPTSFSGRRQSARLPNRSLDVVAAQRGIGKSGLDSHSSASHIDTAPTFWQTE